MRIALICLGLGLAACAAPEAKDVQTSQTVETEIEATTPWRFEASAPALKAASCPEGTAFERAQSLSIIATEIDRGSIDAQAAALNGMSFAGAWHLTADDPNFGGLSGLDTLRSGSLLAISDAGAWVWIGIDPETGVPDGIGSIGYMKGADGKYLSGKREGDAEGLAFKDGLALVSFERNHRIEAFDLEGCGVGALAAKVADLNVKIEGQNVPDNRGAEALSLGNELHVGFEMKTNKGSPNALLLETGELSDFMFVDPGELYALTGADFTEWGYADLYRAYDPVRGNRTKVKVHKSGDLMASATLKPPLPVDNFEGIAFGQSPEGKTRLWLISDNNFNEKQRTLLFAFDLD
jgi:hypothetical protein